MIPVMVARVDVIISYIARVAPYIIALLILCWAIHYVRKR